MTSEVSYFIANNEKYFIGEEILRKVIFANLASTISPNNWQVMYSTTSAMIGGFFTINTTFKVSTQDSFEKCIVHHILEDDNSFIVTFRYPHGAITKVLIEKYPISSSFLPEFKKISNPNEVMKSLL